MLSITFAAILLAPSYALYTCEELEFCNNIRNKFNETAAYYLTNLVTEDAVTADIVNVQTSDRFSFRFVALAGDTFRLTVQDTENSRYTPENDALDGAPAEVPFTLNSNEDGLAVLSVGDNLSVNLYSTPFKIEILRDNIVIIEINKGGRLIINNNEDDRSLALDASFPIANTVYGIPQHAESLSLPTTAPGSLSAYRMFNVDYGAYPTHTRESLYGAIGVLYGISTNITSGLFWMNGAQTFVDITNEGDGAEALFISETGALEVFLFAGPTLRDCVRQYTTLTGVTPLPQYFTLGYHQCRYSYMTQEDVETVIAEFDNNNFPMDVIWLDIDYSDGYKYFTWNYTAFPDPLAMQAVIVETGRKLVAISDPHIKVEEGYPVYDQALEQDYFVKNPNGSVFEGICWPGISSYIDYFNPDAQEWYGDLYLLDNFPNTTINVYIWNDMNEPSVFEADEQTMPGDLVHNGNIQHKDVHNMYGFKQTQATHAGLLRRDSTRRPFILSRAHFAGSQRYTAVWTGDNVASWAHLQISIPMILTESLGGIVFCGADVGGFSGNVEEELLQRWYQVGVWYPFYRGHSDKDTARREPYLYSDEVQERIRRALRLRYAHIPYWYTLFFEHELNGDPVIRPLSYHYPEDRFALKIDQQWLVGSDIMVAPVLEEGAANVTTYFPGGENYYWYDLDHLLVYPGVGEFVINVDMDSAPYYYRAGSIIFRKNGQVRSTQEQRNAGYNIYVFLDINGQATGNIYRDDLESFEYRSQTYSYYRFTYNENRLSVEQLHEDTDYGVDLIVNTLTVYSVTETLSNGILSAQPVMMHNKFSIGNIQSKALFNLNIM